MKAFTAVMLAVVITGCASQPNSGTSQQAAPPQAEQPKWENADWSKRIIKGEVAQEEAAREYRMAEAACDMESGKVSVPAPTSTGPTSAACINGGCYGFGQGTDKTATIMAFAQRVGVRRNCMISKGWEALPVDAAQAAGAVCLDIECKAVYLPNGRAGL